MSNWNTIQEFPKDNNWILRVKLNDEIVYPFEEDEVFKSQQGNLKHTIKGLSVEIRKAPLEDILESISILQIATKVYRGYLFPKTVTTFIEGIASN